MKVQKQDIEAIKRYCEEEGIDYYFEQGLYSFEQGLYSKEIRVKDIGIFFDGKIISTIQVKDFFNKVRGYYIRKGKKMDKFLKKIGYYDNSLVHASITYNEL